MPVLCFLGLNLLCSYADTANSRQEEEAKLHPTLWKGFNSAFRWESTWIYPLGKKGQTGVNLVSGEGRPEESVPVPEASTGVPVHRFDNNFTAIVLWG